MTKSSSVATKLSFVVTNTNVELQLSVAFVGFGSCPRDTVGSYKAGHVAPHVRATRHDRWMTSGALSCALGPGLLCTWQSPQVLPPALRRLEGVHLRVEDRGPTHRPDSLRPPLPSLWTAWIDNTAGEATLKKGYGKGPSHQRLTVRLGWPPEFNRVPSAANISQAISRDNLTTARSQSARQ